MSVSILRCILNIEYSAEDKWLNHVVTSEDAPSSAYTPGHHSFANQHALNPVTPKSYTFLDEKQHYHEQPTRTHDVRPHFCSPNPSTSPSYRSTPSAHQKYPPSPPLFNPLFIHHPPLPLWRSTMPWRYSLRRRRWSTPTNHHGSSARML